MSLFRGTMRPPTILSDEAIERYLAAIRAELAPDPLFRRRLRGEVTSRFVAASEGIDVAPRSRSMGRVGRAVLYASFTLALSATSVLAASQQALPGDPLYALKRQVEDIRAQVLPAGLHDDLAAYALAERIDELGRLADRGDWGRVEALAVTVEHDFDAFVADSAGADSADKYLTVLRGLLDRLPEPAQEAVQAVIDRASGARGTPPEPGTRGGGTPASSSGGGNSGSAPDAGGPPDDDSKDGSATDEATATPKPKPTKAPRPEPTPKPANPNAGPDARSSNQGPDDDGDDQ